MDDIIKLTEDRLTAYIQLMPLPMVAERFRLAGLWQFNADVVSAVGLALDCRRGVFAHGERGRGKTHLAAAVIREYALRQASACLTACWQTREENGWRGEATEEETDRYLSVSTSAAWRSLQGVVFANAVDMMDDIRSVFDDKSRDKRQVVDGYAEAALLIVDDIGMDKSSEFVRETFDGIVNRRWADGLLTVFTSNLDFEEIDRHYQDHGRMTSRIAGMCDVIQLAGEDRRRGE